MAPPLVELRSWLEKADSDRGVARLVLAHKPESTDAAAFHCQQAVEKLLKAYLVSRQESFEKTHDLVELLACCARHDSAFEALEPQVAPLTPMAVRFRYPGHANPTAADVQRALAVADEIWEFVLARLPAEAQP